MLFLLLLLDTTPLVLSFGSLVVLYFIISYVFFYLFLNTNKSNSSIHSPPSYPILGCLTSFYNNRFRLLNWYTDLLAESPSQTTVIKRLGARRTIVTANPDNVEYILKTNFSNFPKGRPFTEILGDLLGNGIFNVDGEQWRAQRKFASHGFTTKSLRGFVGKTLEEEVNERLLPILSESATDDDDRNYNNVDLQDLLKRFAFDVVCKVSLGFDPCCLDPSMPVSPLARAFDVASEISARRGAAPVALAWKMKRALGVGSERVLRKAIEHVHECVDEMIEQKSKRNGGGGDDLLSRLISEGHEKEMIRDMVISFIMAGRDTTSAVMTWLFWLLSQHTHVEEQLVNEIKTTLTTTNNTNNYSSTIDEQDIYSTCSADDHHHHTALNYDALKEMPMLHACLCESMRLYPPVAWDSKHAIVDDKLPDGTPVKSGDRVTYFPYGMGRMEALWGKDRLEFKPDRWFMEAAAEHGGEAMVMRNDVSAYKFPVFQAGPRVCLGKEMALVQMKYVVAAVLDRFQIRPVRPEEPVFVPFLTAHMAGGFNVRIQRRAAATTTATTTTCPST
ncbi:hypothetical protein Syun_024480 [Stephania yunnanensis]|uniref:Cytochrome P450 n=1 Tax=Stephania yunnanensis TaxID=152371 RepID=A0AAP0I4G9_9MAGN